MPTGLHIFSLLTVSNVPIYKVRRKFEKKHKICEKSEVLIFLSLSVSIRDIFSRNIAFISS